jgi:hypothetical protein
MLSLFVQWWIRRSIDTMKESHRIDDDAQLAAMGHKAELKRNFSML